MVKISEKIQNLETQSLKAEENHKQEINGLKDQMKKIEETQKKEHI